MQFGQYIHVGDVAYCAVWSVHHTWRWCSILCSSTNDLAHCRSSALTHISTVTFYLSFGSRRSTKHCYRSKHSSMSQRPDAPTTHSLIYNHKINLWRHRRTNKIFTRSFVSRCYDGSLRYWVNEADKPNYITIYQSKLPQSTTLLPFVLPKWVHHIIALRPTRVYHIIARRPTALNHIIALRPTAVYHVLFSVVLP